MVKWVFALEDREGKLKKVETIDISSAAEMKRFINHLSETYPNAALEIGVVTLKDDGISAIGFEFRKGRRK